MFKQIKYFSTFFIALLAILATWWMWNYYMQSPWTRDGKVRAEIIDVSPLISGQIIAIHTNDNQPIQKGDVILQIDPAPFQIEVDKANAALETAKNNLTKAKHEYERRKNIHESLLSKEELDNALMQYKVMESEYKLAEANAEHTTWQLQQTNLFAPIDGYVTKMKAKLGSYASAGEPVAGILDQNSFYVQGYFEETKLKHIHDGDKAKITLFSSNEVIYGSVESIGRAITDLNEEPTEELVSTIKPNMPWIRLAQRIPVKIKLDPLPENIRLISGTTCSIDILSQ